MKSDAGAYIGGGSTNGYTADNGDGFDSAPNGSTVRRGNRDWRFLELAAPTGQSMGEGSYSRSTGAPFREPGAPGLDVGGKGRGCRSGAMPWEATVTASNGVHFNPGKAALDVDGTGYDRACGSHVNVTPAATVRLTGGAKR